MNIPLFITLFIHLFMFMFGAITSSTAMDIFVYIPWNTTVNKFSEVLKAQYMWSSSYWARVFFPSTLTANDRLLPGMHRCTVCSMNSSKKIFCQPDDCEIVSPCGIICISHIINGVEYLFMYKRNLEGKHIYNFVCVCHLESLFYYRVPFLLSVYWSHLSEKAMGPHYCLDTNFYM